MNAIDKAITAIEYLEGEINCNITEHRDDIKKVVGSLYTTRAVLENYKTKILETTYTMRLTYADDYIVERQVGTEPKKTVASRRSEGEGTVTRNALNKRSKT